MSQPTGARNDVLIAAGDRSFGNAVVDAVEATGPGVCAERIDASTGALTRAVNEDFDGAVVDGHTAEVATVVDRLTDERGLPVVVLTDSAGDGETAARAIEAGATDVFPRSTASAQFELVVERITSGARGPSTPTDPRRSDRAVFETVATGLVVHDSTTGEILDVNERFREMVGYAREDLVGESVRTVLTDAARDGAGSAEALVSSVPTEGSRRVEWRYQHTDGQTYPAEVSLAPVELDGTERVLATVRDITERKRREREYEQIFDMAGDGIVVHDPESGDIVDANRQVADLLGYDREAFFDRPLSAFQASDESVSGRRARELIRESADRGGQQFDWPLETAEGETVWVRARHAVGEIGGEERIVALLHDITERRRREAEFEEIFNKVQGGITINHPETGEILDVNDSFCDLVGYSRDEIIEMGVEGVSATEEGFTEDRASRVVQTVTETGDPRQIEWAVRTSDGEKRWLSVRGAPATIGGEQRYLSLTRDVTEIKRREREYEQIFHGVNDSITIHDPETGELLDVNDSFCDLVGDDRDEIVENGVMAYTPDGQGYTAEAAKEFVREVVETGEPKQTEWAVETASGEIRELDVTGTAVELGGELRYVAIDRDVTERRDLERTYRDIFENVSDGLVVHDPDTGEIRAVNEQYCELTGYERSELVGSGIDRIVPGESGYSVETAMENIQRARTGETQLFEFDGRCKDGSTFPGEVHLSTVELHGSERVLASVRDITEQRRREREYEQIFNGVQDAIVVHDPETHEMVDVNDAFCDLVGYDRERILELGTAGLSVEEEGYTQERANEVISTVMETGQMGPLEWKVETSEGEHRLTEVVATTAEIGGESRHISIQRDITELRRREREYEQIFDSVEDGLQIVDPETLETLDVNDAFLDMFGYDSVEEVCEAGIEEMSLTEEGFTVEQAREIHDRVRRTGDPEVLEWRAQTVDGALLLLELKITPARIGGEDRSIVVLRDVTEDERREQRLAVFNRVLRHNLRNQLDVIRSHANRLTDQTPANHAEQIVAAADKLAGIGARARETDRIVSAADTPAEIDLSERVRELVGTMESSHSDVAVETSVPDRAPLHTNEDVVTMAVESALQNALDHAATTARVAIEDSSTGYVVTVADDGPGIAEEELVPIEAGTETDLQHGSGLGLWQLRWSVDELNGELSFDASGGTTVRIGVPDRREATHTD